VFAKTQILLDATGQILEEAVNDALPAVMDGKWLFKVFPKGYTFPSLTCLHETQKARDVEIFSRDINSSDWEAYLKIILHGKVCFLNENVAVYRRHSGNATKTLNVEWIVEGAEYVDGVYDYALRQNLLPAATLDRWRLQLLKRYFLKQLVRVRLLGQSQTEAHLKDKLRERYPQLSKEMMRDVRYKAFLLACRWKPLMRFGFKYYVKQEGFYEDLVTSSVLPEHHQAYHGLKRTASRQ
jgi:hypothetical protein